MKKIITVLILIIFMLSFCLYFTYNKINNIKQNNIDSNIIDNIDSVFKLKVDSSTYYNMKKYNNK